MYKRQFHVCNSTNQLSIFIMNFFSLPDQQKALLITKKGARMSVGTRAVAKPGVGQVVVRNIAVALNPVDMYVSSLETS